MRVANYKLKESNKYDCSNYQDALKRSEEWGDKIPIGVFYKKEKEIFKDKFSQIKEKPMVNQDSDVQKVEDLFDELS
jgi:2-oxoglutarate ferredoxin oxidoreductase subunit beta